MQRLSMSREQRRRLSARNALAINAQGQEVLHGLSFEESRFLIRCATRKRLTEDERERYDALTLRHERLHFREASLDEALSKDEERLG